MLNLKLDDLYKLRERVAGSNEPDVARKVVKGLVDLLISAAENDLEGIGNMLPD